MHPQATFSNAKTQGLYQILQSFKQTMQYEPIEYKDPILKLNIELKNSKRQKIPIRLSQQTRLKTPKTVKIQRWIVQRSCSKSKQKQKHKQKLKHSSNISDRAIKSNKHTQKLQTKNQAIKSRLFSQSKLQTIRKTLDLVQANSKNLLNIYFTNPILSSSILQRSWLKTTNNMNSAHLLWVTYHAFVIFYKIKMQQKQKEKQLKENHTYLINYLPIDICKIFLQLSQFPQGFVPKMMCIQELDKKKHLQQIQEYLNDQSIKCWILKPLKNANFQNSRICNKKQQVKEQLKNIWKNNKIQNGYILQEYISAPFLYNNRKFIIKIYLLITNIENITKGYLYDESYIQTSSLEYQKDSNNICIHFTGNQVQKQSKYYERYQPYNKITQKQFNKYLQAVKKRNQIDKIQYKSDIQEISFQIVNIISKKLNNNQKYLDYFQIFQLDFIVDSNLKVLLIGINPNPNLKNRHLTKQTQKLMQNIMKLTLDVKYPPPVSYYAKYDNHYYVSHFDLIFDSRIHEK